nr:MAG TPA: hypothetical protein [Caudoviricetes sp.]
MSLIHPPRHKPQLHVAMQIRLYHDLIYIRPSTFRVT